MTKKRLILFLLFVFILSFQLIQVKFPVYAEDEEAQEKEEEAREAKVKVYEEEIKLFIGETKLISAENPKRIAIGNPEIADITNVSNDIIVLTPKSDGTTNFSYWDDLGQHTYIVTVISQDLKEVKSRIEEILKELNITGVQAKIIKAEKKVLLLGNVKSEQDKILLDAALAPLKANITDLIKIRSEDIVEIEAEVIELDKDGTKTLGFSWPGSLTFTEKGSPGIGTSGAKWSNLFKVLNINRTELSLTIDALAQEGKARILSKPRLACLSGREAEMLVGGEKPIFTTSVAATTGASGTNIEYKEFGVRLNIKPTVIDDGKIHLALKIEVSEVGTADVIGAANQPTAKAFPLTRRDISTELYLNDGQTLGIGGLIKQKTDETIRKTPILGDIPILGLLFTKKTTQTGGGIGEKGDTELFVMLTPRIVPAESQETLIEKSAESVEEKITAAAEGAEEEITAAEPQETQIEKPLEGEEEYTETESADDEIAAAELQEPQIETSAESVEESNEYSIPVVEYANTVRNSILEKLTYPDIAMESGYEGKVKLKLHLVSTGELLSAAVEESSNYEVLDSNALSTARNIGFFPIFPEGIGLNDLWLEIPIEYSLK